MREPSKKYITLFILQVLICGCDYAQVYTPELIDVLVSDKSNLSDEIVSIFVIDQRLNVENSLGVTNAVYESISRAIGANSVHKVQSLKEAKRKNSNIFMTVKINEYQTKFKPPFWIGVTNLDVDVHYLSEKNSEKQVLHAGHEIKGWNLYGYETAQSVLKKSFAKTMDDILTQIRDITPKEIVASQLPAGAPPEKPTKGPTTTVTENTNKKMQLSSYSQKYAIIIGISDYKYLPSTSTEVGSLIDLKYADKDAREFNNFLMNKALSGGDWNRKLYVNKQATTIEIVGALESIFESAHPRDLIFVFFSGHGRSHPRRQQDVFLLTYDFDPQYQRSGLEYAHLRRLIEESKAEHIVTFIDACRSGVIGFAKGPQDAQPQFNQNVLGEALVNVPKNKVIFSSGRSTQASWEDDILKHGVFTYFLLKGLTGEAPDNHETPEYVDLGELEKYVTEQVSNYTEKHPKMAMQVPRLWESVGIPYDNFPLALRRK